MLSLSNAGLLRVMAYETRDAMGKAAAEHVADLIEEVLRWKPMVSMIFAAAPSQNEFLRHLTSSERVNWGRVIGFHMDEYLHLDPSSGQLFSQYLAEHLVSRVRMAKFHVIDSHAADSGAECERYTNLLKSFLPDIVCMGIGENGHIAFNDPPVANFKDPVSMKVVELDETCRQQQVNDGCFPTLDLVPRNALTLTVPMLMSASYLSVVVPSARKAEAVRKTACAPFAATTPSTILRSHPNAVMFLDMDAASLL